MCLSVILATIGIIDIGLVGTIPIAVAWRFVLWEVSLQSLMKNVELFTIWARAQFENLTQNYETNGGIASIGHKVAV
ncbi:hypothetical protein F4809DRAFT_613966 [Biscogniauxia mediterranea]|nr:hypothetical protein F4809DRAFT_613966 [Biscogniauxia mediterranea]